MCNHKNSAPRHQIMQRGLHQRLRLAVESRRRLVQNQYGRVLQQSTRDSDALTLAPGKPHAPFSNDRIVTRWKSEDEFVCQGSAGRSFNFLLRDIGLTVSNVVASRVVEQHRILSNDSDLRSQRRESDIADVIAVDEQAATGRIKKAGDKMHQRALAGAARSHDGQHFSLANFEVDIAQYLAALFALICVGETDMFEAHAAGELGQRLRARLLADFVFEVHELEYLG